MPSVAHFSRNINPELNNEAIVVNNFVYCAKMFKKKSLKEKV